MAPDSVALNQSSVWPGERTLVAPAPKLANIPLSVHSIQLFRRTRPVWTAPELIRTSGTHYRGCCHVVNVLICRCPRSSGRGHSKQLRRPPWCCSPAASSRRYRRPVEESKPLDLQLSREDIRVLHQALNEVLGGPQAIEDWEFDTRMGATREEVRALLNRISAAW